jgi:hypothetical protein
VERQRENLLADAGRLVDLLGELVAVAEQLERVLVGRSRLLSFSAYFTSCAPSFSW